MVSKKQWLVIILVTLYGIVNGVSAGLAGMAGAGIGSFVLAYGAVLGYNGVDLTKKIRGMVGR